MANNNQGPAAYFQNLEKTGGGVPMPDIDPMQTSATGAAASGPGSLQKAFDFARQGAAALALIGNAHNMTNAEFLKTATIANPDFAPLAEVMKSNPALSVAFQDAFANNKEFRDNLMAGDDGSLSLDNLHAVLTDEKYGAQAQTLTTSMLNKVAKNELSMTQVEKITDAGLKMMQLEDPDSGATEEQKAEAQQHFFQTLEKNGLPTGQLNSQQIFGYLHQVMTGNPDTAAKNLVESLGLTGEQAGALQEILSMAGSFLKFLGQPYYEFVQKWGPTVSDQVSDMAYRLGGEADADAAAREAERTPSKRQQDDLSRQGHEQGGQAKPVEVTKAEGMAGVKERVALANKFGVTADKDGNVSVDPDRERELAALDARNNISAPAPAFT